MLRTTAKPALLCLVLEMALPAPAAAQRRRAPEPTSPIVVAPIDPDAQRAHEAYDRGRGLFQEGRWSDALTSFREAFAIRAHPTVLLSIAACEERLGDARAAVTTLERYLSEAPEARDRAEVQARISALRRRPAIVHVTSEPPGAQIEIDDHDTGLSTPADVELTPGAHALVLRHEGREDRVDLLTVEAAERREAAYTLSAVIARTGTVPLTLPLPVAPPDPVERSHAWTWVAAGVTGVAVVTGSVLGGLALSTASQYDDGPTRSLADRGDQLALSADLAFGVAVAAGLTALFAWAQPDAPLHTPR